MTRYSIVSDNTNLLDIMANCKAGRLVQHIVEKSAVMTKASGMTYARDDFETLPRIPPWITSCRAEALEDVALLSDVALDHLHLVVGREEAPQSLLWERLALCAAEACALFFGRLERVGGHCQVVWVC